MPNLSVDRLVVVSFYGSTFSINARANTADGGSADVSANISGATAADLNAAVISEAVTALAAQDPPIVVGPADKRILVGGFAEIPAP